MSGRNLKRNTNSTTVINIIPPRADWGEVQLLRNLTIPDQRCGPHFSFVDPFIVHDQLEQAIELLVPVLASIPSFTCTLEELAILEHPKSATLYLKPVFEPADGVERLLAAITAVFPQCAAAFLPHLSVGKYGTLAEAQRVQAEWEGRLRLHFAVDHVYVLQRAGPEPFRVARAVPLQGAGLPGLGPGAPSTAEQAASVLLMTTGPPPPPAALCAEHRCLAAEVLQNPAGPRNLALLQFQSAPAAEAFVAGRQDAQLLTNMAFPAEIGGSCSLSASEALLPPPLNVGLRVMPASGVGHTTAVCLVPPPRLTGQVQALRRQHDKAYERWMPHVNLLYPFVPAERFPEALHVLRNVCAGVAPFELSFPSLGSFQHGREHVHWAAPAPAAPLLDLYTQLVAAFPMCAPARPEPFAPHMTLASPAPAALLASLQAQWQPFAYPLTHIHVIARSGDAPFRVVATMPLLGTAGDEEPVLAPDRTRMHAKVEAWLAAQVARGAAPRDLAGLTRALGRMTRVPAQCPGRYLQRRLAAAGALDGTRLLPVATPPLSGPLRPVLEKAFRWVAHSLEAGVAPKTPEALARALEQLGRTQIDVPASQVVAHLEARRLLAVQADGTLQYLVGAPLAELQRWAPRGSPAPAYRTTAAASLVTVPPPQHWSQIVAIKRNHMNPRITRPPYPHITLLQPFVEPAASTEAAAHLKTALAGFPPVHLAFKEFKIFRNKGSYTVYLEPEVTPANGLEHLFKACATVFGASMAGFEAHIGVGFFRNEAEAEYAQSKYQSEWNPFEFDLTEIYIMHHDEESPFSVREIIPIGEKPQRSLFKIGDNTYTIIPDYQPLK